MKIKEKGDWDGDDTPAVWKEPFIDSVLLHLSSPRVTVFILTLEITDAKMKSTQGP